MGNILTVRIGEFIGPERRSQPMDYFNPLQAGTCGMVKTTRIFQAVHMSPKNTYSHFKLAALGYRSMENSICKTRCVYKRSDHGVS